MFRGCTSARSLYLAAYCVVAVAASQIVAGTVELTQEPTSSEAVISVSGVVTTPSGEPIEGATVVLRAKIGGKQYWHGLRHNRDVLAHTVTDAKGEYQFQSIALPPRLAKQIDSLRRSEGGVELIAWSSGNAIQWTDLKGLETKKPLNIQLRPEAKVSGQVRDEAGKPANAALLRVDNVTKARSELEGFPDQPGELNLNSSELNFGGVADAEGRFDLHHLPQDHFLIVGCKASGMARQVIVVDTGSESDLDEVKAGYGNREPMPVVRSPIELSMKAAKDFVVRVVDSQGKPVTGGVIQAITDKRQFAGWESLDERGEARLQLNESGKYEFRYASDPLEPRLGAKQVADIDLSGELQPIEIRLLKSRWLTGQVVDAETLEPVAGAYVYYASGKDGDVPSDRSRCLAVSGRDGKFQIPALPGPGELAFKWEVEGYFPPVIQHQIDPREFKPVTYPVDVSASEATEPVTLTLARGLVVRGVVRDSSGAPVKDALVRGKSIGPPYISRSTSTDAEGRFELAGLSPHVKAMLSATTDSGAAQRDLEATPAHPWEKTRFEDVDLTLEAGVKITGRVVDERGKPMPAIQMKLYKILTETDTRRVHWLTDVETDSEGRYEVTGLAPGDGFQFEIVTPDGMVAPIWDQQSPFHASVPVDARDEYRLPDAVFITRGQSLQGVVVDPAGKPVPGVHIFANIVGGMMLRRPQTETDTQGRFELHGLPDKPLELMAYKPNPQGGVIRNMARAQPEMHQKDIRITYDPELDQEFEDLD